YHFTQPGVSGIFAKKNGKSWIDWNRVRCKKRKHLSQISKFGACHKISRGVIIVLYIWTELFRPASEKERFVWLSLLN
ncbi:MAG: hypothetical protein IJE98_07515, partial [Oscillospiraceae bacterium]|nr:hypothetical protein [Oscillospiraceae bacterium]